MDALPEIKLIAVGAAAEAAEDVAVQMDREGGSLTRSSRIVNGTRSAQLLPAATDGLKAQ